MPAADPTEPEALRDADLLGADLGEGVRAAFTRRSGGRSGGPWAELNLGLHVGDDPALVAANRQLLAAWLGSPVAFGRQVHGTTVRVVGQLDGSGLAGRDLSGEPSGVAGCDVLVTTAATLALGVLVADCVPVLLADPQARVVAAAHAGRRGLLDGVLAAAVGALVAAGGRAARTRVVLGPAAGGCCYEVPQQLQDDACRQLPQLRSRTTWGTPSLDLRAGCTAALERLGVADVVQVGGCTIEDDAGFSYRRAATTGRFAGVVRVLP